MPIIKARNQFIYFAHVPKCAGTSVEEYLIERFGPVAFQDRRYYDAGLPLHWSRTSPQHIDARSLSRLFPENFFADSFTIVRHPLVRLKSAYLHAQRLRGLTWVGFEKFLTGLQARLRSDPYLLDHHFTAMSDLVPDWTQRVFRLEDGDAPLIAYFDELAGDAAGARKLPHAQKGRPNDLGQGGLRGLKRRLERPPMPELTESLCRQVYELFPQDYERFGYAWDDPIGLQQGTGQVEVKPMQQDIKK